MFLIFFSVFKFFGFYWFLDVPDFFFCFQVFWFLLVFRCSVFFSVFKFCVFIGF